MKYYSARITANQRDEYNCILNWTLNNHEPREISQEQFDTYKEKSIYLVGELVLNPIANSKYYLRETKDGDLAIFELEESKLFPGLVVAYNPTVMGPWQASQAASRENSRLIKLGKVWQVVPKE